MYLRITLITLELLSKWLFFHKTNKKLLEERLSRPSFFIFVYIINDVHIRIYSIRHSQYVLVMTYWYTAQMYVCVCVRVRLWIIDIYWVKIGQLIQLVPEGNSNNPDYWPQGPAYRLVALTRDDYVPSIMSNNGSSYSMIRGLDLLVFSYALFLGIWIWDEWFHKFDNNWHMLHHTEYERF